MSILRPRPEFLLAVLGVLWISLHTEALADVRISEFSAKNTRAFPDITDFEDYPDWIELENTGDSAVALSGAFLSDDPSYPLKWAFSAGAVIPAHGFLVVVADGKNAPTGQTFPRGYWPWRSFVTERHHTNFSISASGGTLIFTQTGSMQTTVLVRSAQSQLEQTSAQWRYLDNGISAPTGWREMTFEDSSWKTGASPLGYGDPVATEIGFGANAGAKPITSYFRHRFTLPAGAAYDSLLLKLRVDDGAVVYLNGTEVVRRNLPEGEITGSTAANVVVGGADESTYFSYSISPNLLREGENVLAVEVHQCNQTSSDLVLDLALEGQIPAVNSSQSVSYGVQVADVSMGLDPEAPSEWVLFAHPTPGSPNSGPRVTDVRLSAPSVTASPRAGSYATAQQLTLSASRGQIRYTLDGSVPTPDSPVALGPIPVTATAIVRARAFVDGAVPGPILTQTYFIGSPAHQLPVVSVVAPPETLFGDQIGIYRNQHEPLPSDTRWGLRDVYKGKDAPGHVEFFAPDGTGFHANCGIRIGGENNWVHPQKALNLALSSKYGESDFRYALFPDSPAVVHSSFTLRDGGDNWDREMLRDGLFARLAHGHLKAETGDYRPSVVYINGAYYGLHDIRERWDATWFSQKYRIPIDGVDHLLYGHVTGPEVTLGVEKGDSADWLNLIGFLNTNNLTQSSVWSIVESRIDLESFMDFVIAESYGNNTSWVHNREFWRQRKTGEKWKWFLTDMDRTFSSWATTGVLQSMLDSEDVLSRLKTNASFRQQLAQRYALHMASTFAPSRVTSILAGMDTEISSEEVARHAARWNTGNPSTSGMTANSRAAGIREIQTYAQTRATNIYAELVDALGVAAPVSVNFSVSGNGQVLMEGIPVSPSTLRVFPGIPIRLHAIPAPGYQFAGWTGANGGPTTTANFASNSALQARFIPAVETPIGGVLTTHTTLSKAQSPYVLDSDLIVAESARLTIPAGVTLQIPAGHNIRIRGQLLIEGNASQPVRLEGRLGARWGGLSFEECAEQSVLRHVVVRNATSGVDPVAHPGAISALNSNLLLEWLDIDESENPIFCRGGSVILRDSQLHTPHSGDCINVKQGAGQVIRCVFYGNNAPDTDAIDFDGVTDGLIEDNRIYRFQGANSDGIDIGEHCVRLLVQGNCIYFNSDKGISIGQGSDALLRRNLIVGCALGVGIKDAGSYAHLDQNSFINCQTGVAAYEKNFGMGGGSAQIENSLFSGCTTAALFADALSSLSAEYCLCDSATLPGQGNIRANPRFIRPLVLNYQLLPDSPARDSGDPNHPPDPDGTRADIGACYLYRTTDYPYPPSDTLVLNEVFPHGNSGWIEILNRSAVSINLGGWWLSDDPAEPAKFQFPPQTILRSGAFLLLKQNTHFGPGSSNPGCKEPFSLSPEGQTLVLSSTLEESRTGYLIRTEIPALPAGISAGTHTVDPNEPMVMVAQSKPTPAAANAGPLVGPIVFSAIRSKSSSPDDADEFVELRNISNRAVPLQDSATGLPWRIRGAVDFDFPSSPSITLQPGQRLIVAKNAAAFQALFSSDLPPGTQVLEWTEGSLKDGDKPLQLLKPNPLYVSQNPSNEEEAAALFAGTIPVLNVVIPPAAMEILRQETDWTSPNSYVEVTLEEQNGEVYEHVGLKLKGSVGSFNTIDGKPAFSINTDKYPGGKRFHGLDRFQLNNCAQDGSALHELLAGELARKAGVPASRCTHAILKLNNDRFLGIYVLKEGFSKDFLAPFFEKTDGRLYDGGFLSDIRPDMELDRGDPANQSRLLELCSALADPDEATRLQRTQAAVDVDAYLRYLALENILGHWDGYSHNINNYRVYENPATGKFHFILHGMDQTWGGSDLYWEPSYSVGTTLWSSPANRIKYTTHLQQIVSTCIQPYNWNQRATHLGNALRTALLPIDPGLANQYADFANSGRNDVVGRLTSVLNSVLPGTDFGSASPAPTAPTSPPDEPSSSSKYHLVDLVAFDHDAPWPLTNSDLCLIRIQESAYGNNPANWASAPVQFGNVRLIPVTVQNADPTGGDVPLPLRGTTRVKPGTTLKITATPRPGFIFSGWTGESASLVNPLILTVNEPLSVTAHFIPLPFVRGTFAGRIQNGSGSWTLSVAQSGAFSGQLILNGRKLAFKGSLNALGIATLLLDRGRLQLDLSQNLDANSDRSVSGTLRGLDLDAALQSAPLPSFSKSQPCPIAGQHTLVLPPDLGANPQFAAPSGTSSAVLTVSTTGSARFVGSLADGTPLLFSAPISTARGLAVGVWLSKRKDTLAGDFTFSDSTPETISGSLSWHRPADDSPKTLPWDTGFTISLNAVGSRWVPPLRGTFILPNFEQETVLSIFGPDSGTPQSVASLQFSTAHRATETSIPNQGITCSVDPRTGFFSGKFRASPSTPSLVHSFRGVLLRNQSRGEGYFLDTKVPENSGKVALEPKTTP